MTFAQGALAMDEKRRLDARIAALESELEEEQTQVQLVIHVVIYLCIQFWPLYAVFFTLHWASHSPTLVFIYSKIDPCYRLFMYPILTLIGCVFHFKLS